MRTARSLSPMSRLFDFHSRDDNGSQRDASFSLQNRLDNGKSRFQQKSKRAGRQDWNQLGPVSQDDPDRLLQNNKVRAFFGLEPRYRPLKGWEFFTLLSTCQDEAFDRAARSDTDLVRLWVTMDRVRMVLNG